MKHLKTLETISNDPQIGDYVIIKSYSPVDEVNDFINNNIGQIIDISQSKYSFSKYRLSIIYDNIPSEIKQYFENNNIKGTFYDGFRDYKFSDIIEYSKNKEDLEIILSSNKYNL